MKKAEHSKHFYARGEVAAQRECAKWFSLWEAGLRFREIAKAIGQPADRVESRIAYLRKKYGWFPIPDAKQVAKVRYAKWRDLWAAKCSVREIAQAQGVEPTKAKDVITHLRRSYGWFPVRGDQAHGETCLEAKYGPWRKMWARQMTYRAISEEVRKTPAAVQCTISNLRARYGWFPLRGTPIEFRPVRQTTPAPKEVLARYGRWNRLWDQGFSAVEIAGKVGLAIDTVRQRITKLRQAHGMFIPRQRACTLVEKEAKFASWRKLWNEGYTYAEMAPRFSKSPKNVANTILRLRCRYGWFPRRVVEEMAA
jgi:hypothetical protein